MKFLPNVLKHNQDKALFNELEKSTKVFLTHYEEILKWMITIKYEKIYHTQPDDLSVQLWLTAQTSPDKECPNTAIKQIAENHSSILLVVEQYKQIDRMHKELHQKTHPVTSKIVDFLRNIPGFKKTG